ncbi:hypothetical protein HC766_07695 [Candidatus Gracilibacteria bacterium]|nr:hypothetical protein [Candidatus Gracilibacteria bacterium]
MKKNKMYLASTYEKLGSQKYAMRLIGRSSVGRLGLFLQVSADLGHTKSSHSWTLELVACNDIKVYKYMKIGQISFWRNIGEVEEYKSHFNKYNKPQFNNKIHPLGS